MTNPFRYCVRLSAGGRLSPYLAYKKLQYQTVMQLAVGPRKRSAAGQALKIALCLQSECLLHRGKAFLLLAAVAAAQGFDQGNVGA